METRHRFIEANGIRFHVAEAGEGPLVLLLHGFPECWYSWRHLLSALAGAGYHAVAPDMRGYNLTDKPRRGYDIATLVEDVAALVEALAGPGARAHVIGHDWGGVVAWQAAWRRPDIVRSLTVMNAPHPRAFADYLRRSPLQMVKSSYMLFFGIPRLPEWLLTRRRARAIAGAFRRSARRQDAFSAADLAVYREAMLRPGAATATLNYYRQAVRQGRRVLPDSPIEDVPVLVLWGRDDPVLRRESNRDLRRWVRCLTVREIPDCGHWTQQEQPDAVRREVLGWLAAQQDPPLPAAGRDESEEP